MQLSINSRAAFGSAITRDTALGNFSHLNGIFKTFTIYPYCWKFAAVCRSENCNFLPSTTGATTLPVQTILRLQLDGYAQWRNYYTDPADLAMLQERVQGARNYGFNFFAQQKNTKFCHQMRFRQGLRLGPRWESSQRCPDLLAALRGPGSVGERDTRRRKTIIRNRR